MMRLNVSDMGTKVL